MIPLWVIFLGFALYPALVFDFIFDISNPPLKVLAKKYLADLGVFLF